MSWTQVTPLNDGLPISSDNPLPVTQAGAGAGGLSTSDNQIIQIAQLDELLSLNKAQAVRLDEVSPTLFYVGKASAGTLDGDAAWQIIRYTQIGAVLKAEFAGGTDAFDKVWNDRLTLTYI